MARHLVVSNILRCLKTVVEMAGNRDVFETRAKNLSSHAEDRVEKSKLQPNQAAADFRVAVSLRRLPGPEIKIEQ
ncbi:hypothetical protein STEG23_014333, partial [Scotinomys teguina]